MRPVIALKSACESRRSTGLATISSPPFPAGGFFQLPVDHERGWIKYRCRSRHDTHRLTDFRVVLPWHDGLEPDPARGWSPAGSGRLERKEVIACVVITRGGSPKGSRRVARPAAALLTIPLRLGSTRSGPFRVSGLVDSVTVSFACFGLLAEIVLLTRSFIAGDYGQYHDRGWWWSWAFTRFTTGCRAEDGVSI